MRVAAALAVPLVFSLACAGGVDPAEVEVPAAEPAPDTTPGSGAKPGMDGQWTFNADCGVAPGGEDDFHRTIDWLLEVTDTRMHVSVNGFQTAVDLFGTLRPADGGWEVVMAEDQGSMFPPPAGSVLFKIVREADAVSIVAPGDLGISCADLPMRFDPAVLE